MTFDVNDMLKGEVSYSQEDKEFRNRFVQEYLRDYSSYAACVRMGLMDDVALEQAKEFMGCPYVLKLLADAEAARAEHLRTEDSRNLHILPDDFAPHDMDTDRQRIVSALFREAFYKGPGSSHSSRVAALGKLSDIYKLTKEESKQGGISTNVMVVPAMGSVDGWEAAAADQQSELKRTVKE